MTTILPTLTTTHAQRNLANVPLRLQSEKMTLPSLLVLGQMLLFGSPVIWAMDNFTEKTTTVTDSTPNVTVIVVPSVLLSVLAIAVIVLLVFFCVIRKKRQTEGTYRPSAEEQTGARSVQTPDALKLPKEERLI